MHNRRELPLHSGWPGRASTRNDEDEDEAVFDFVLLPDGGRDISVA